MQLRIKIADLQSAPGFLADPVGGSVSLDRARAAELYSFLPGANFEVGEDELVITIGDKPAKVAEATSLFDRAAKRARDGDHAKACEQYTRGLALDPLNAVPRRDLAMSLMARGDNVGAETELKRVLLLAPANAWAWVILGNLTYKANFAMAVRYFQRAIELDPSDPYAWNGMGAMHLERRDAASAIPAFETALRHNPGFANAYFGLASALAASGDLWRAFETWEQLFRNARVQDSRSLPTFQRASVEYIRLAGRLADESIEAAEAEVASLTSEAERVSGFPVRFEDTDAGARITGSTEMAWKHGRDHHVIRVRSVYPAAAKMHLKAHELCHIILEAEARAIGANRWFSSNTETRAQADRDLGAELTTLRRTMPAGIADRLADQLFHGLMAQLFNLPIDMLIERRIAKAHPGLRYAQIQSLALMLEESVKGCTAPEIVRTVPRRILQASRFLNACYAAFVDRLFNGALAASPTFVELGVMDRGLRLLEIWDRRMDAPKPGAEYDLIDAFADELRLRPWFTWQPDTGAREPATEGVTDASLLAAKAPAAVQYFLSILRRFDAMTPEDIQFVARDAASAAREGVDYGSPEKSYRIPAYGEEPLSGLQVMCVMFAAFQRIAPAEDMGMDLHEAYQKALAQHEERKRGS